MNVVLMVAAGTGRRMGSEIPKQYLELAGEALIARSIHRFKEYDPGMKVVLVLAREHRMHWERIATPLLEKFEITVTYGGENRFDSVCLGLDEVPASCIVGIHDAVRPLVSQETIHRCYESAARYGSGIPVLEMDESVRMVKGDGLSEQVDRSSLRRVQTPQTFKSEEIMNAYQICKGRDFTDDASVYQAAFGKVHLVEGNRENIKITHPADLLIASRFI